MVVSYTRKGHPVRSYTRGDGTRVVKAHKLSTRYLKPSFESEYIGTIGEVQDDPKYKGYSLVTDSQDVKEIWNNFGNDPNVKEFDGFLVKVGDGDYDDVLGFPGNIPYLYKGLYRIVKK
jgi:hypothetical protein